VVRTFAGLFLAGVLSGITGCYSPRELAEEYRFARQKPRDADLVGTWVPTAESLKFMRTEGGYVISTHELVLNADKTFLVRNMPDWWKTDSGESRKGFDSASGRWELSLATGDRDWGITLIAGTSIINFLRPKPETSLPNPHRRGRPRRRGLHAFREAQVARLFNALRSLR